jgi:uncharacterized RDD family membrane protein YckC
MAARDEPAGLIRTSGSVQLRYASFETRLVAFVLDLIVLASFFALFVAFALLQLLLRSDLGDHDPTDQELTVAAIIILLYLPFVPLYFVGLWTWRGQTLGKMAMAIRVVRSDGRPAGVGAALLRLVGYLFSTLLLFAGFLMIAFDHQRRGLHDRLADTIVVDLT